MPDFSYLSILKNYDFVIHDYLLWRQLLRPVAGRTRMKPAGSIRGLDIIILQPPAPTDAPVSARCAPAHPYPLSTAGTLFQ